MQPPSPEHPDCLVSALVHAAALEPQLFSRLLLLDPVIFSEEWYNSSVNGYTDGDPKAFMVEQARRRKSKFDSWQAMYSRFAKKMPYNVWESCILADYAYHGLDHKSSPHGCQLLCRPEVEADCYASEGLPDANIRDLLREITVPATVVRVEQNGKSIPCSDIATLLINGEELLFKDNLSHFIPQQKPQLVLELLLGKRMLDLASPSKL